MAAPADPAQLVIFARRPTLGVGKRRLAAAVGDVEALRFQRTAIDGLLRHLAGDPRWTTAVATAPDRPTDWLRDRATSLPQGRGDLGQRLTRIARLFPTGRLVIIGSDTTAVCRADVAAAFNALRRHDAVVGPARDGGYWLIGLRRSARGPLPFDQIRWSSPDTLADTLARLEGRRTAHLRMLEDVDDLASYRRFAARPQRP
jgi:rSAM/selenodomain-associated transferase 1